MNKITFELEGNEYELPEYITIENYVKIFKLKDIFSDEFFAIKLLNILTGAPIEVLTDANYNQIEYLSNFCMNLFPKKEKFVDRFEFDGIKYGFIDTWKKISFGEFVDLDTLMSKKGDELLDYIHIITAILYRPIISEDKKGNYKIEKYDPDTMEERAEKFKKLNINIFIGSQVFFSLFIKKYLIHFQLSSITTGMTKIQQLKTMWMFRIPILKYLYRRNGDGTQLLTDLQTVMLRNLNKSLKSLSSKRSTNSLSLLIRILRKKNNTNK